MKRHAFRMRFITQRKIYRVVPFLTLFFLVQPVFADDPWTNTVNKLVAVFTGPIAKGLALIALVLGGLALAFNEGDSKRGLASLIFGVGLALSAAQFLTFFF